MNEDKMRKLKCCIRADIHFEYPIEAKDAAEAEKKFYEISGDALLKWMAEHTDEVEWEYEVVSVDE